MGVQGRMGLPQHVDQVCLLSADVARQVSRPPKAEFYAVVTPDPDGGTFDAEVVDTAGNQYVRLSGYRTVALPNSVDAEPLKALASRSVRA